MGDVQHGHSFDGCSAEVEHNSHADTIEGVTIEFGRTIEKARGEGHGHYEVECYDSEGNLKWRDTIENSLTNAGMNDLVGVYLVNATQTATWYIGLVDNASFSAFAAADTMSSHAGWIEATGYSQGTRVAWGNGAASSQSTTNASPAQFSMTGTATIKGAFITSVSTKSGTTGTLFATGSFSGGNQAVSNGDTLKVTYTYTQTTS